MRIKATILVMYMKHDQRFAEIILQNKDRMKSVIQIENQFRVKIVANQRFNSQRQQPHPFKHNVNHQENMTPTISERLEACRAYFRL